KATILKFTNINCHSGNSTVYTIHTCRLKAVSRNKIAMNLNATLNYKASRVYLHYQVVKKANGYRPWLYNISVECCDYLKRRNNPIVNMLSNIIKEYSNFIHPCPFEGRLFLTGLYLKPTSIPLPMPSGEYGSLFTLNFDNMVDVHINVYFEVIEDLYKRE
ncbi:hypothetical protein KR044_002006, partial [Drosophila immigrans]